MQATAILLIAVGYVGLLFAIAYRYDREGAWPAGRPVAGAAIYAMSIGVYCTSWTFYGSVGRASASGVDFLPVYLGPTLTFCLGWPLLAKMLRVSKTYRITSIADFIASRYGKSGALAGLVTVIAVIGSIPYIALQLKALDESFVMLANPVDPDAMAKITAVVAASLLAAFAILFGTRHIDASEHHQGLVTAIAFESVVKLLCFVAIGLFVGLALFPGYAALFADAEARPELAHLFRFETSGVDWTALMLVSMAAAFCLPRQFQMIVVENRDERHLASAVWSFPLYLLLINLFVLPVALAGLLVLPSGSSPDLFVLNLPLHAGARWLAVIAFIGGLSAATSMVVVESIALSTMICNDLVMPVLLRLAPDRAGLARDLSPMLLGIRRVGIVFVLLLGFLYFWFVGPTYALVSIGLVSFAAVAQFAPAIVLGLFWRGAGLAGAAAGIIGGFLVWIYTLFLPSLAHSGLLTDSFVNDGVFGLAWTRPYALFGLAGLDPITHSLFWSMLVNLGLLIGCSIIIPQSPLVRAQAVAFVEALGTHERGDPITWRGSAPLGELRALVGRFFGPERATLEFTRLARRRGIDPAALIADPETVDFAERLLAGVIGGASARVLVASTVKEEPLGLDDVMRILEESSQLIQYSRRLKEKSRQLEETTRELQRANESLKQLDRMKDDLVSTASHELRTPLTSIRSFAEILHDNPDLETAERQEFLQIIISESERLTRLINDMLDLAKIEAGQMTWHMGPTDLTSVVHAAVAATRQLFRDKGVALSLTLEEGLRPVNGDADRLKQVVINLLSNAVKFAPAGTGRVSVMLGQEGGRQTVRIADNGPGIAREDRATIFEPFRQGGDGLTVTSEGTGLGLPICCQIVAHHGGEIEVESEPGQGATFIVALPMEGEDAVPKAASPEAPL